MPSSPWISAQAPVPGRDYLALISYLPLLHYRAIPSFFRYSLQTQRQLRTSNGLIAYALDAKILNRRFWTLSVWEDSAAMMEFVRTNPHSKIMKAFAPHMGKTKFAQWNVTAADLPLKWDEAKAHLL